MTKNKAEELLHDFQLLTHINIALYDGQFHCVCNMADHAPYCAAIHRSRACLDRCIRSDTRALEAAKQTRMPQIYTCPYGLWEAIYPISDGGQPIGYLFAGPVLPDRRAEDLPSLFRLARSDAPELSAEALTEASRELLLPSEEELAAAERLLFMMAEHMAANRLISSERPTLGYLIGQYVRKNLARKITLADLGRRFHCSTVTLTETFRKEFGMTIMQYVLDERMHLACRLLSGTERSVTDVAEHCGFPDVEYFSRCFKQKMKCSPSEWRRRQKG